MSISGILSNIHVSQSQQNWGTRAQKVHTEFQQLGQDLQAGNLSRAQSDFNVLSQNLPNSVQSNISLSQAYGALRSHHQHHAAGVGSQSNTPFTGGTWSQMFANLGSSLQAGNLSAAQAAYSTLQQDLQQLGWGAATASQSVGGMVNIVS